MAGYDFITYTKRVELADFLSLLPLQQETGGSDVSQQYDLQVTDGPLLLQDVSNATAQDLILQKIKLWVHQGWPAYLGKEYDSTEFRLYHANRRRITVSDGCLWKDNSIIIPKSLRTLYVQILHDQHTGKNKKIHLLGVCISSFRFT